MSGLELSTTEGLWLPGLLRVKLLDPRIHAVLAAAATTTRVELTLSNKIRNRRALSVADSVDSGVMMGSTKLPDLLGYDELAAQGLTRRGLDRLLGSGEFEAHRPFDADTFSISRTEHALPGGSSIGLYAAERTLIDLFRLRHAWSSDLALGALKRWLRGRGNSPTLLLTMAEYFPKARAAIQQSLEILL